jgi:Tol biopolymer transport system component
MLASPQEGRMPGQPERTLRPEDEISHYRVVSPLGAGGMGEVYLAQDRTLERSVALKILPPDLVRNEDRVRRFRLEAKSASSLSHPNIVTIYEIGQDPVRSAGAPDSDPVHYISMELVSGKTLSALIHEDKADLRTLVGYLAQAAEGLAKAHAAGIVHRDLKPGNIMVSADGFAKILDFGLAKLTEKREGGADISEAPTLAADGSAVGSVVGTAGYMSPEQVAGRAIDSRSDIFSFGCILYEAATRRKPFAAETGIETMHKILNEKPVPVEEINDKVPAELRRLIRRCLAKSPDQRVQSIKDLALELREIVEEYDTLSVSGSSTVHGSGAATAAAAAPGRTWGRPALAAAAVVAAFGLAIAWWGLRRGAGGSAPRPAFQTMRMSTQTSRGDVLHTAISPDGRYLAYVAGAAGRAGLRVRQVETGSDVEVLHSADAALESPAFSPDGNYLFYLTRKPENPNYRALLQVPSLGGTPRERVFDVDSRVSFSPDGKSVVFWRGVPQKREARLVVFDLESSRERPLATVGEPENFQGPPAWSPDGTTIAVCLLEPAPDLQTTVAFLDAESGSRRDFLTLPRTIFKSLDWLPDGRGLVATGEDLRGALYDQVFLIGHPDAKVQQVTNDFNVYAGASVSREAIAAVRQTRLANLWLADAGGGPFRPITSVSNPEDSNVGFSVAGPESVVFTAPRDHSLQVFSIGTGGGEPRPLTSGALHSFNARAAAGIVLFDREDASGVHIWRMSMDGSGARQITSGGGEQVGDLSRDGRFAAFAPYDAPRVVSLLSVESGAVSRIPGDASGILGFAPDGTRLMVGLLETDAQGLSRTVWKAVSIPDGTSTSTFRLPGQAVDPTWSPDSRALTFRSRADAAWNVFRQDEGKEPVPVTRFKDGRLTAHAWSPDGTRLAVVRRTGEGSNVWVTRPDGSQPVQVTQLSSADVFAVRFLPDNRRLVVSAGKLSRDAVLIRSFR